MRTLFLVKASEADLARDIERRLLALPKESGILFVGVKVIPETDTENPIYDIFIGCDRGLEEGLMDVVVRSVLRPEIEAGVQVRVFARRGVSRS